MTRWFLTAIALFCLIPPTRAGDLDCGSFPNDQARFSCYEAASRAPKPDVSPRLAPRIDPAPPRERRLKRDAR